MSVKYAVFILTFGRPDKVKTIKSLVDGGYTGEIFLICSSDDDKLNEYQNSFKNVIVFNKKDYRNKFDIGDNLEKNNVVVFARNANFDIAKELGYEYFIQLDDDYLDFRYKFDHESKYIDKAIKNGLDYLFKECFDYYLSIENCKALSIAQGGDFMGGDAGSQAEKIQIKRKTMNVFFLSIHRRFEFVGRINEDVNTYVSLGSKGELMFQINNLAINQLTTQSNSGGLTEFYLETGTYTKSFYTVMYAPSCTKIRVMGQSSKRLHHSISWDNAVPKILSEDLKKK